MRRLLTREDGIAMPAALLVLTLCLLLTAAIAGGADSLTASSGADQRAKRGVAAADAGISVAIRRLRSLAPTTVSDTQCLTSAFVGTLPDGNCPPYTEALGPDASFTYYVTPATTTAGGCYEVPGTSIPASWRRRCITSIGTVGDEVRRVQTQVVAPPPGPGHWMGILGLDEVHIMNSAKLSPCDHDDEVGPVIGSNLSIEIDNKAVLNMGAAKPACSGRSWGTTMPDGRLPVIHWGAKPADPPHVPATKPFTIPPPPRDWESVEQSNSNAAGATGATGTGSVNFNPTQRTLDINGKIALANGGDFHLCGLRLGNQSSLDFSQTQKTRIFIDSPTRPESMCQPSFSPLGLTLINGSRLNWPESVADTNVAALNLRAKNVEVYIYNQYFAPEYGVRIAALVQNERNTVRYINSSLTWGAVAAKRVEIENSGNFQRPSGLAVSDSEGPPYRSAGWTQCRNAPTDPGDPESGCS